MDQNDPEMRQWLARERNEAKRRAKISAGLERMAVEEYTEQDVRALLALVGLPSPQPVRISALCHFERRIKGREGAK